MTANETPLLSSLPGDALARMERAARTQVFAPGDVIVAQGEVREEVSIIRSGEALVTDYDADTACDSVDPDDDNDGCDDTAEQQTAPLSELSGGRRDYHWFWDFYDAPTGMSFTRDGSVPGGDIFATIGRFNSADAGPGDFDRFDDPLSMPNALVIGQDRANYHPAYDRGGIIGPDIWDLGAANGSVAGTDIFNVLGQFNHVCA